MFRFRQQKFNSLPHRKKVIHLGQFVRAGCNQQPEKSVLSEEPAMLVSELTSHGRQRRKTKRGK